MLKYCITILLVLSALITQAQHNPVPPTTEFTIKGAVKNELRITISDLQRFKQDALGSVTIKNKKGEEKGEAKNMKGVLLKTLLDSAGIYTEKHKEYSELCVILTASDDYRNIYSWNELYNTSIGDHVYIITEMDGKLIDKMESRILVMSLSDINSGRRHLKGLAKIEVKKVQ